MVRHLGLILMALLGLTGCKGFDRPRDLRKMERPDLPEYTIEEQQRRARAKYGIPEDDRRLYPNGYVDRPSPTGR